MKRWWVWVIALFILVMIAVVAAALKPPSDDLAPFRPYAISERRIYYGPMFPTELIVLETPQLYGGRGKPIFRNIVRSGDWHQKETQSLIAFHGSGNFLGEDTTWIVSDGATVSERRPLTALQVWLLRLKRFRWDPFDDPPPAPLFPWPLSPPKGEHSSQR